VGELCTDDTAVAVSVDNLTPHDAVLAVGAGVLGLGLVDIGNTLAKIELSVFGGVDTLDANKSLLLILVPLATTVAKENSARVKSCLGGLSHYEVNKVHLTTSKKQQKNTLKKIMTLTLTFVVAFIAMNSSQKVYAKIALDLRFKDYKFYNCVKEAVGPSGVSSDGVTLKDSALNNLYYLECRNRNISDVTGLDLMKNLISTEEKIY